MIVTIDEIDDALDKCRHGKTAAQFCVPCDDARIDLTARAEESAVATES